MAWKNVQYENGKMRTSSGGGGGGASNFADLEDVDLSNLQDGQVPKYNATTGKWENANESGGSGHTYSTTEQVVGTWIDGSTIYEKTIECDITISNTNWNNTNIVLEHDKVISCLLNDGTQCWNATSGKYGSGATATIGLRMPIIDSGGVRIRQIVLQYTKPTS